MIGKIISNYRIKQDIGRDGMGIVYRRERMNIKRNAMIKILTPALTCNKDFKKGSSRKRAYFMNLTIHALSAYIIMGKKIKAIIRLRSRSGGE